MGAGGAKGKVWRDGFLAAIPASTVGGEENDMAALALWRLMSLAAAAAALVGAAAAAAHPPYAIATDRAGNAYFSDLEAVWKLAPDGRLSLFRPGVEGTHVHELATTADGAVEGDLNSYDPGTQVYKSAIWRRSADGREAWVLAPTASAPKGMGLWSDRAGNRYTAQWPSQKDRRTMLFRRDPKGRTSLLYGPREQAAAFREVIVSSVGGMAFPADGSVVFADARVLRRVDRAGAVAPIYTAPAGAVLRGVSLAPDGRLLVADFARALVLAVTLQGRETILYRAPKAWPPTAAAIAGGRLLVLEANADPYDYVHRVRVEEVREGKGRVVADPSAGPSPEGSVRAEAAVSHPMGKSLPPLAAAVLIALVLTAGIALRARRR